MKKLFLALAMVLPMLASAQKVGHVNTMELMQAMPELAEAQKQLEADQNEYKQQVEQMQQELQAKYAEFQQQEATLTDVQKQSKYMELQSLDERIQKFAEFSQQELQRKQQTLMAPIQDKLMKAIEAEAKKKGLSYVMDAQAMIYVGAGAVDVTPDVKKALNLK